MIDTVRVAELNNELGVVQDTIQRATRCAEELVAELRATLRIEQPEGKGLTPPAPQPAPGAGTGRETTSSSGDASRPIQPAVAVLGRGVAAGKEAAGLGDDPAASTSVTCAGCGREFRSRQSLGPHMKGCKGRIGPVVVTETTATNGRRTTFLCSRNCGSTFDSREASDAHEREARCSPKATPPPTYRTEEWGRQPITRGGGMGE